MNTNGQGNIKQGALKPKKEKDRLELIVVIMLGITALLTAWASWVGSHYASAQSDNYNTGNLIVADGNTMFNFGIQTMLTEMLGYSELDTMIADLAYAKKIGDKDEVTKLEWKINRFLDDLRSTVNDLKNDDETYEQYEIYQEVIRTISRAVEEGESFNIMEIEGYLESFIKPAQSAWEEAGKHMEQGASDSSNSSKYLLVTVIYAMTLFMLGIIAPLKKRSNQLIAFYIAVGTFLIATIYMLTLPGLTDFGIL